MRSTWNIVLLAKDKKKRKKIIESFTTQHEANNALNYRYTLWYHLGADPNFSYALQKVSYK